MPNPGRITKADLETMVGSAVEGQRLEFKADIPVHPQRQAEKGGARARDAWWDGKPTVGDHGRDKLLEEVVAFANAQGGRLVLGMDEEADGRPVAAGLRALPRVAELAGKFRDWLVDCVEPRLPAADVQAVEFDGDGGGAVVVDVEASRLGPHWVKGTRKAAVRRDDKCLGLTMTEVHEMVLRNARRFEDVRAVLDRGVGALTEEFKEFLLSDAATRVIGGSGGQASRSTPETLPAYAIGALVVAHEDLGISRVSSFADYVPPRTCIGQVVGGGGVDGRGMNGLWPGPEHGTRCLGGIRQLSTWDTGKIEHGISREGVVSARLFFRPGQDRAVITPHMLAGVIGCLLGTFDKLRISSGRPGMPGELAVAILTDGQVRAAPGDGRTALMSAGPLPPRSAFPRRTVASSDDFGSAMTDGAQDLLDAANAGSGSGIGVRFAYLPA